MSIMKDALHSGYCQELSEPDRLNWLDLKRSKFLPTIDNLYYGVFIEGDTTAKDGAVSNSMDNWLTDVFECREKAAASHEPVLFAHDLYCTLKGYTCYRLCLTEPDLYDIFITKTLPNDGTPRMLVQLRAMGLWTRGVDEILLQSYNKLSAVLVDYGLSIEACRESRIDYCYHTNAISSPDKAFKETRGRIKGLYTNLKDAKINADVETVEDGVVLHKDYICFGSQKANNVRARVYDKVKEVIELGYKGFFFKLWRDNGLINAYDQWCMEYALPHKNTDYLHKARVAFYAEHGQDPARRKRYSDALKDKNTSLKQFRAMADEHMPPVTVVVNVEYETKRKFYYLSDDFIDGFKTEPRLIPCALKRLYRILDNRCVFLDYLTSKTLCFHTKPDSAGAYKYAAWWERLRNVKLGGIKTDEKLLRDYSFEMDKKLIVERAISAVAAASVYEDNVTTGFVEDMSDLLANISDNMAHKDGFKFLTCDGEVVDELYGGALLNYLTKKASKEKLLKNRKRRARENAAEGSGGGATLELVQIAL